MHMKFGLIGWLLLLSPSVFGQIPEVQTESVYAALQETAYRKALGLTRLYFGGEAKIQDFSPTVAGAYRIIVNDNGDIREVYLMSDLQSMIEGKLYSTLIRTEDSAHGIKALTKYALKNQQVDMAGQRITEAVNALSDQKNITQKTAAGLLENGFTDHTAATTPKRYTPTDISGISNDFYQQITELQNITVGTSKKEIYLFIDLNCPACRKAEPRIMPFVERGQLVVHYIPVGFLPNHYDRKNKDITDSEAKAMYALIPNENHDRHNLLKTLLSSEPVDNLVNAEAPQELRNRGYRYMKENTLTFFKLPIPATPMAVYLMDGIPRFKAFSEKNTTSSQLSALIAELDKVDS